MCKHNPEFCHGYLLFTNQTAMGKILDERLNLDLFEVAVNNYSFSETIKPETFNKNIEDLFQKLKDITVKIMALAYLAC
jgi:hypothetical protein